MNLKPIILMLAVCFASSTFSQDTDIYDVSWSKDKYLMGATGGLLVIDYILDQKKVILSEAEINSLDPSGIWGIDQGALDNYNTSSATLSDYFRDGVVIAPLALLFSSGVRSEMVDVGIMYAETFAATSAITSAVKSLARRKRPFLYNPNVPLEVKQDNNATRSFYSGHTSHVTSVSFFTATVFSHMYPDSKYKYLVWGGAILAPAITAYARYDAGKHFITDVVIGYGVGAVIGCLIPRFHLKSRKNKAVGFNFSGSQLSLTFALN